MADQAEARDVREGMHGKAILADELRSARTGEAPVPAWPVMISAALLFSVVIDFTAALIHAGSAFSLLMAVEITPVPRALVSTSASPGFAPSLARTCRG